MWVPTFLLEHIFESPECDVFAVKFCLFVTYIDSHYIVLAKHDFDEIVNCVKNGHSDNDVHAVIDCHGNRLCVLDNDIVVVSKFDFIQNFNVNIHVLANDIINELFNRIEDSFRDGDVLADGDSFTNSDDNFDDDEYLVSKLNLIENVYGNVDGHTNNILDEFCDCVSNFFSDCDIHIDSNNFFISDEFSLGVS